MHESLGHQRADGFGAQAANVQGVTRAKVLNGALELRPTSQTIRAAIERPLANNRYVAYGAAHRHLERPMAACAVTAAYTFDDFRNDIARSDNPHDVADAKVLARNLLTVVERRSRHGHAADLHRPEDGHWCEDAGPADLHDDVLNRGLLLSRRELEGQRPPRVTRGRLQTLAQRERVHFQHDPVNFVFEGLATFCHLPVIVKDVVETRTRAREWDDLESPRRQGP